MQKKSNFKNSKIWRLLPKIFSVALIATIGITSLNVAMMMCVSIFLTSVFYILLGFILKPFQCRDNTIKSIQLALAVLSFSMCSAMLCEAYLGLSTMTVWQFAFLVGSCSFLILWKDSDGKEQEQKENNL
ncbi:MAG: hypothetical protein J6V88_06250 [Kiritimatiellae bacterium]|nr:hypothetical protein [Kiritimatiellia bacterium]